MSTTQGAFRRSLLPRSIVLASAIVVSTGFLPAVPASAQSLPSIGQLGGSLPGIGDLLGGSTDQSERQLSVTPATDLSDGATVTIKGVGYPANANIYLAQTIEKPKSGYPSTYGEAAKVTVGADGSFTQEMKVATSFGDVDCTSTQCYVASFTAFPNLSDRSNDQWVPITFKAGATSQAAQSQGSTSAAPSGGQSTGQASGSGSQSPSQSRGNASVSLSKTSDLNPSGDTIRVEGKGFKTSGPGIYVGIAQNDQMDVTNADSFGPDTQFVSTSRGNLKSDGSFSVDLPVSAKFGTADCMQNACSVYTIAAHGSSDRSQDTATAVSFAGGAAKQDATLPSGGGSSQSAGSASSGTSGSTGSSGTSSTSASSGSSSSNGSSSSTGTPSVSLSTTELNPSGSTAITVSGSGFKTSGNGIYVAVAEKNKFSTTNADAFSAAEFVRTSQMSSDGSFSTTLNVEAVTSAANCVENDCALYTFAAHGSSDRSQDTATDLSVGGSAKEREEAVKAGASKTGESKASGSSKASGKASAKSNASGNGLDEVDVQTQQAATNSPLQTAAVAGTGAILGALIFGAGILVGRRQKSVD
ncbi:neocarzinostatin apoprotein domain-containing protein [Corynebacterium sp. MSK035]|uniref:neocarzinostatin apoprotein domain-containing protein n=1 Tax=Corynebacterium sp. MSK035 TaxID=3050192 RepID=UPI00254B984B|nr:neocarzinostatin apoprotein domain-containing protein [Corynebacterium sp. MSK035]MDK8811299.1 neocarzinostatin apoprotein domain-containing protein [Corynebacterium sp. MSK035]